MEIAAALAAAAVRRGDAFGLATQDARVRPGAGGAQLERVLDRWPAPAFAPTRRGWTRPCPRASACW